MRKGAGWTCVPRTSTSDRPQHSHPPPQHGPQETRAPTAPRPAPRSPPPSSHPFLSRLKGSTRRPPGALRLPLGVPNRDRESGLRRGVRGARGWAGGRVSSLGAAPSAHPPPPRDRLGTLGNRLPSGRRSPSPRCTREAWGAGGVQEPARDSGPLRRWAGGTLPAVISIY